MVDSIKNVVGQDRVSPIKLFDDKRHLLDFPPSLNNRMRMTMISNLMIQHDTTPFSCKQHSGHPGQGQAVVQALSRAKAPSIFSGHLVLHSTGLRCERHLTGEFSEINQL